MALETALRRDKVPGALADAAVMRFMGWGWRDLCEAPAQMVEDIREWMRVAAALDAERAQIERARLESMKRR